MNLSSFNHFICWVNIQVSHMDNIKKSKKGSKKESSEAETKEDQQFS